MLVLRKKGFFTLIKSAYFLTFLFIVSCAGNSGKIQATSTAAAVATEISAAQLTSTSIAEVVGNAVLGTLTAIVPTATNTPEPPTNTPVPTNTSPPTNTPLPTATPRPTFTPTPDPCFESFSIEEYSEIDVRELQQYPDDHIGQMIKVSGTVKQLTYEGVVSIAMFAPEPDTLLGVVPVILSVLRECVNPGIYEGTSVTVYGLVTGDLMPVEVETLILGSHVEMAPVLVGTKVIENN